MLESEVTQYGAGGTQQARQHQRSRKADVSGRDSSSEMEEREGCSEINRERRYGAGDIDRLNLSTPLTCSNLSPTKRAALHSNPNLTTKPADKGGAVVVWGTDLYIAKVRHQPSDTSSYHPLDHDPTPDTTTSPPRPSITSDSLKALHFFLSRRSNQPPSTDTLIRLTELVLTLNCFSFNSSHSLQTKGVAMGIRMGPSYACLF
eukprot:g26335.t1